MSFYFAEKLLNASKQEITLQEQESQRKKKEFEDHERQLKEKLAMVKLDKNFIFSKFSLKIKQAEALQRQKEAEADSLAKASRKEDVELLAKMKKNEAYLKGDIERLKRESEKNNTTWEKKFEILKKR